MNRDESIALFQRCETARGEALAAGKSRDEAHEAAKAVWDAWAQPLLAERKQLEEAGEWDAKLNPFGALEGQNDQTKDWLSRASVDFSRCRFYVETAEEAPAESSEEFDETPEDVKSIPLAGGGLDFRGFDFPAAAWFNGAAFSAAAWFGDATFSATAWFGDATFSADASFDGATFSADASFGDATFSAAAWFNGATFSAAAWFTGATFSAAAWFTGAIFSATARFTGATFSAASFVQARFEGPASFNGCTFEKDASFRSISSKIGFDLSDAEFGRVPDFTQSTLHRDPRLDNVTVFYRVIPTYPDYIPRRDQDDEIIPPEFGERAGHALDRFVSWPLRLCRLSFNTDPDMPAKFRELKRYAIQGEDHRSELEFHAQEIRTSRFAIDKWWHPRFWVGVLYEAFSDFGRSVRRPALAMVLLTTLFAGYFLSVSIEESGGKPGAWIVLPFQSQPCIAAGANDSARVREGMQKIAEKTNATIEAWSLALKNTFVFINWDRADAARRNFGCLYGLTTDGRLTFPYVPSRVSFASLIQIILSSILLFLLLLGIRNMLKLK